MVLEKPDVPTGEVTLLCPVYPLLRFVVYRRNLPFGFARRAREDPQRLLGRVHRQVFDGHLIAVG